MAFSLPLDLGQVAANRPWPEGAVAIGRRAEISRFGFAAVAGEPRCVMKPNQ